MNETKSCLSQLSKQPYKGSNAVNRYQLNWSSWSLIHRGELTHRTDCIHCIHRHQDGVSCTLSKHWLHCAHRPIQTTRQSSETSHTTSTYLAASMIHNYATETKPCPPIFSHSQPDRHLGVKLVPPNSVRASYIAGNPCRSFKYFWPSIFCFPNCLLPASCWHFNGILDNINSKKQECLLFIPDS